VTKASTEAILAGHCAVSLVRRESDHMDQIAERNNGWDNALLARLQIRLSDVTWAVAYKDQTPDETMQALLELAATALAGVEHIQRQARR
jgi:hypothetical protein